MTKERKQEINNFIGIFDNFIPSFMIDKALEWYKKEEEKKCVFTRLDLENTSPSKKKRCNLYS